MHLFELEKVAIKEYLDISDVSKYYIEYNNEYLIYANKDTRDNIQSNKFSNLKKHLDKFNDVITSSNAPYGLHRPREQRYFESPKLICKGMFKSPEFYYDQDKFYVGFSFSVIIARNDSYSLKVLLACMNSKVGRYWFNLNAKKRGIGVDVGVAVFRQFPVPDVDPESKAQIEKWVDLIQQKSTENMQFKSLTNKFFQESFGFYSNINMETKWNELSEYMEKKKIFLTNQKKDDLYQWLIGKINKMTEINSEIESLDNKINQHVYKLYGLTPDEIKIIEEASF